MRFTKSIILKLMAGCPMVNKDAVQARRNRQINNINVQKLDMTFEPKNFSEQEVFGGSMENGDKARAFMRKTIVLELESFANKEKHVLKYEDIKNIRKLVFPELHCSGETMAEVSNEFYKTLRKMNADGSGAVRFEEQRLHAVQQTNSCELKSLTVAAAYVLDDELSYQAMLGLFIRQTRKKLNLMISKYEEKMKSAGSSSDKTAKTDGEAEAKIAVELAK